MSAVRVGIAYQVETRYEDDRGLSFEPSSNREVVVKLGDASAAYVDAVDLLNAVASAVGGAEVDHWGGEPSADYVAAVQKLGHALRVPLA